MAWTNQSRPDYWLSRSGTSAAGEVHLEHTGTQEYTFDLSGGRLCLDFANTLGDRLSERPHEHLAHYSDLVSWSRQAGIVDERQAQRLVCEGGRRLAEAAAVLERAIALREAIYRIMAAAVSHRAPEAADLATFNAALAEALGHARVVPTVDGFAWDWAAGETALDSLLWPVVRSAADLLTSGELSAVRECAAESCGWLFVDTSRNRSRRWCDMKVCGNRAKARRHYARERARGE